MCLAVPMKIMSIDGSTAVAATAGVEVSVGLDLVDGVSVGDYVIVHAGYAITALKAAEAEETLAILQRLVDQGGGFS